MPGNGNDGRYRSYVSAGKVVEIVRKQDQRTGKTTRGTVSEVLTSSSFHPHGIKVRLKEGMVGRVSRILDSCPK